MTDKQNVSVSCCSIPGVFWLFSVVYTFMVWGFGWGLLSIVLPIFPLIDLVKYLLTVAPWLQH